MKMDAPSVNSFLAPVIINLFALLTEMNCTGDATADRLSAQCYGSIAGHPAEVRVFRTYRPHSRLCYGLSLAHSSLSTQAKCCYSPNGQTEFKANLTHSSELLLKNLGVPTNSSLRFLLRPGPHRWALGTEAVVGSQKMALNLGLRLERPRLYGWHGLLEFGNGSVSYKAEVTGRMRMENWCHIWADVSVACNSYTSNLMVSTRCKGLGKLMWVQIRKVEGDLLQKTSLTLQGHTGNDGLKCSLDLKNNDDMIQCLMSAWLKDQRAEVDWTLWHHWASLQSTIPKRVDIQGVGQLGDTSISGNAQLLFNTRSAHINMTATVKPSTSLRVTVQQNMSTTALPEELAVSLSTATGQAELNMESDACSMHLLEYQHGGGETRKTDRHFFVHQRCALLKVREETKYQENLFPNRGKAKETSSPRR